MTEPYPLRLEGRLDPGLSRGLWLVKWLLVIPHYVVLFFLWIAFLVLTVAAFFAILFTGRYPRGIFDFNVGVMRWSWRVGFYAYSANGTDRYPPFTLEDVEYPARLQVEYPERLSRGLVLVKWWLLAIPHYLVVAVFVGGGYRWYWGGLVSLLVLFGSVALLFTGTWPRSLFDVVLGMNRWAWRVAAYAALMTDEYPPFRLDQGETEPGGEPVTPPRLPPAIEPRGWGIGRVLLVALGSVAALIGVVAVLGGGALVVVDQTQRDRDGYLMSDGERFATPTYAFVSENLEPGFSGADIAQDLIGTVQIRSTSATKSLFLGIGPTGDVRAYLGQVMHEEVTDFGNDPGARIVRPGRGNPAPPATKDFWDASARGSGEQTLRWRVKSGSWQVVLMNGDGSPGVSATISIGARLPSLIWIGVGLLAFGAVVVSLGAVALYFALRRRPQLQTS